MSWENSTLFPHTLLVNEIKIPLCKSIFWSCTTDIKDARIKISAPANTKTNLVSYLVCGNVGKFRDVCIYVCVIFNFAPLQAVHCLTYVFIYSNFMDC